MATREERHWQHVAENKITRQIRKQERSVRKEEAHVRRRDWTAVFQEDETAFDDLDLVESERVTPLGADERRKTNRRIATEALAAASPDAVADSESMETAGRADATGSAVEAALLGFSGVVVEVGEGMCRVDGAGQTILCSIRPALRERVVGFTNVVAVGDQVLVTPIGAGRGVVEEVRPRRSALARPDVFSTHLQQVVVANVDLLLIVLSWREPAWWPELTDRYLIAAERNHLMPVICINKIDLAEAADAPTAALRPYVRLGYRVLFTSAATGAGLTGLHDLLVGRTTALAGLSGVGKSSLLSAAFPGLDLRVGEVSARRHEGRHTTTQVSLHRLEEGGFVVDTPGIREFGLAGLTQRSLTGFYPEIAEAARQCQFTDCTHEREPGCAVRRGVQAGRIARVRFENYGKILHDLPA